MKPHLCNGKEPFDSFDLAKRISARRAAHGRRGNPYRCATCGKYHIGSVFSTRRSGERFEARQRREKDFA